MLFFVYMIYFISMYFLSSILLLFLLSKEFLVINQEIIIYITFLMCLALVILCILIFNDYLSLSRLFNNLYMKKITSHSKLLSFLLIFFIFGIVLNTHNIAFCENFDELDAFIEEGHKLRIEVLTETVRDVDDIEFLKDMLVNLKNIYNEQTSTSGISDPFSNTSDSDAINSNPKPKSALASLGLFLLLSLLGILWFNGLFIFSPLLFYQLEIEHMLQLFQNNPALFIAPVAEYYTILNDVGIFDLDE